MKAKQVKALREELGESQQAFADRFGVVSTTVTMWEKNGTPSIGAARRHVDRVLAELAQAGK
jgi:DNA-binding transcriptional regulator YiaG